MKKIEYDGKNIRNERELREYLRTHQFPEPIDEEEMVRLYRKMMRRLKINEFRATYDCRHCYYFQQRLCKATEHCLMEDMALAEDEKDDTARCLGDTEGDCPYGNEVGTCFGFCMRDILAEMRERKRQHEKDKEQEKSG